LPELEKVYNPVEIEKKWTAVWRERKVFTPDAGASETPFTIILPPPNITGSLTSGTLSARRCRTFSAVGSG